MEPLLSFKEAADLLNLHKESLLKLIKAKRIRAYNLSQSSQKYWRFSAKELLEDIEKMKNTNN